MRITNTSVPEIVRETITRNRSIFDCLKMDLINYTALAVKIQPEVERTLGNPVNLNTIVVAIKRFADSLEVKEDVEEQSVLKNARLALTDGIIDIKFSMKDSQNIDPLAILDKFSKITTNYDFFRSSDTFRFLTEDLDDVREIFETMPNRENIFSTGLAKIRISIPPNQNKSDVVSYVAEVLHDNGDNIILILNEKDSSKAYDVLHSAILRTA